MPTPAAILIRIKQLSTRLQNTYAGPRSASTGLLKTVTARLAATEAAGWGDEDFAALAKLLGTRERARPLA